ncbi:hypothetical protein D3C85_781430 [compost metagenome]
MKFQVIGMTENRRHRTLLDVQHFLCAGAQPGTQQGVIKVGLRFFPGADGVASGHFAAAQPGKLRKDEPHPVTAFVAGIQFGLDPVEHRVLRLDKALQVEVVRLIGASHVEAL